MYNEQRQNKELIGETIKFQIEGIQKRKYCLRMKLKAIGSSIKGYAVHVMNEQHSL